MPTRKPTLKPALDTVGKLASAPRGISTVPAGDVRLTLNLPESLHLQLKLHTVRTRTTMSHLVERLIREYLATAK